MRTLTRKLLRDTRRLTGQLASIAAVVACGIAAMVAMRGNHDSLLLSRDAYYERHRFADVFVGVRRAPDAVARAIANLPGVAAVEPRLSAYVVLDVPGFPEPVSGHLLSLPADPERGLNSLYLRAGRYPAADAANEVAISEVFAAAHGLQPGDRFAAVINGRWQDLRVAGVGLSPEFIYEIGPGQIFPDNERFGVVWMGRAAMAGALDQEGAFNDLTLDLAPGASEPELLAEVDRLLAPYGGTGAVPRRDQVSNAFLEDELVQHRVTGTVIGGLFLAIAAFLVNLVLARLVQTEREQIGTLKAFGFTNASLARHYLALAFVPVAGGLVLGWGTGLWLGRLFTELFARYYHFPVLRYVASPETLALAGAVSAIAAAAGALQALRAVVKLPPAEAMRPPAPTLFRHGLLERLGGLGLGFAARMALRSALRRPVTSLLSMTGIALAAALLVLGRYFRDAMDVMSDVQFRLVQQQDVTVTFREVMPGSAVTGLSRLPGVVTTEGMRGVAVELRHGSRRVRTAVLGLEPDGHLQRLVDAKRRLVALPSSGLVLNDRLAARLDIAVGDALEVLPLEGDRRPRTVQVGEVFDEVLGFTAYMRRDELNRLLGEGAVVTGAFLGTDGVSDAELAARLKSLPAVAGAGFKGGLVASFERTLAESMGISTLFLTGFAIVIAVAVAYNGLRIAFSERRRELASLRVLGFGSRQVAAILITEQGLLTLLALPLGVLLGVGFSAAISRYYVTDLFRIPLAISPRSYLVAAGVVLLATVAGALLMLRQVQHLDLVEALKTRE